MRNLLRNKSEIEDIDRHESLVVFNDANDVNKSLIYKGIDRYFTLGLLEDESCAVNATTFKWFSIDNGENLIDKDRIFTSSFNAAHLNWNDEDDWVDASSLLNLDQLVDINALPYKIETENNSYYMFAICLDISHGSQFAIENGITNDGIYAVYYQVDDIDEFFTEVGNDIKNGVYIDEFGATKYNLLIGEWDDNEMLIGNYTLSFVKPSIINISFEDCKTTKIINDENYGVCTCHFLLREYEDAFLLSNYLDTTNALISLNGECLHKYKKIADNSFKDVEKLEKVILPETIKTIGNSAFTRCESLSEINIPNNVTSIGYNAFTDCVNLSNISIPNKTTYIGESAFMNCSKLSGTITLDNLNSINDNTFYGCTNLNEVVMGDWVKYIKTSAFRNCTNLTSVTMSKSVTEIRDHAFRNCYKLREIYLPNSITNIGTYAFYACQSLTNITLPEKITTIYRFTFAQCSNLTSVLIPNTVKYIKDSAFFKCVNLISVTLPDNIKEIDSNAFCDCDSLVSITYKGVEYTKQDELETVLTANGVTFGGMWLARTPLEN